MFILYKLDDGKSEWKGEKMKLTLLEYFEETVGKKGNDVAIVEGIEKITFLELKQRACRIAAAIASYVEPAKSAPVAVFIPKSIWCVTVDVGIWYSGNAYMNLDIKTPSNRIQNILKCIEPKAVITLAKYKDKLPDYEGAVLCIDEVDLSRDYNDFLELRDKRLIDTDPMCLINTSGSTGTPKGVVLNHKSFIDFTEWSLKTFSFNEDEIIGSLSPAVFDIYSYELCLLMSRGATLVVIPDSYAVFPVKLLQLLNQEKVTFIFWVPTIMVNIANMGLLEKVTPQYLKWVWFAGEVFPTKQFNVWRRSLPNTKFANLYGPIEITLDCTYYIVERELRDDEPIPIGYPCRNTDILLLKDDNTLAKPGEEGEICVRGTSLAGGYYNNWEKTKVAFVQNPLNTKYPELIYRTGDLAFENELGEIVFVGRKDTLIKHSGYRIELGEIEHVAINTLKIVDNCCVIYNQQKKHIIMVYESKKKIDNSELRKALGTVLPNYMLPAVFIEVSDEMPRNTNGKIDRLKIKELYNEC